jgi:iron complex outermembrane receptor protein
MLANLRQKCLLTLALSILATPGIVLADSLSGRVLDPQGNVVADAKLKLFDRNSAQQRNTVSSSEGGFRFEGIPAGTYLLEAHGAGSVLVASQEVSVNGESNADVNLTVAGVQTEVVVTAAMTPLAMTEVAKALDIVDSEQLELRNVFQITEALRALPGIQIQTLEGPGSSTRIRTRGLRAADTAVLIDGMRFRDAGSPQNDAGGFLENLVTVDTERIEFMRGSSSSLYGPNSMAGVINIASRPGGRPTHGEFRVEGGGLGMVRSVVSVGGALGTDRFAYSGSLSHLNITKGVRDRSPNRNTSAQGAANYSFTPNITLTGRVWGATAYLTSTESPTVPPAILANSPSSGFVKAIPLPNDQLELFEKKLPFTPGNATYVPNQIDPDGRRISSFINGTVNLQHVVSTNTTYRIAYQGVDTRRGYLDGPAGPGSFEPTSTQTAHFNGRTDTIQARFDQRAGFHNFISGGYEFEREKYISFNDTPANSTPTAQLLLEQRSHAVYGQNQIKLAGDRLVLALSGRAQVFRLDQPVFSGSGTNPYAGKIESVETPNAFTGDAAVAYFFQGSQTKLRTHIGNNFRGPSTYERFGGSATGTTVYGDPRLKPERATALDAGIDQRLFNSKAQVSATYFYTDLHETIFFNNVLPAGDPFGRLFGYSSGGGGTARGVELSAQISPARTTNMRATYTYVNSDQNTPSVPPDYYRALDLAPHTYTMSVTQWFAQRFHTTFELFGRNDYVNRISGGGNRLFVFNGATKANVIFGYELPHSDRRSVEIYGKVENVFNQKPYEDGFIGPQAWAIGGLRFKY